MALILSEFSYNVFYQVFQKIIQGINVSLDIKFTNDHTKYELCEPQFFTGSKNGTPLVEIKPSQTLKTDFSGNFFSKGMILYKVKDDSDFHYLVITWKVKIGMMRGKNSVAIHILDDLPKESFYNGLHGKANRKYPGENINPENLYYRISGGISDGVRTQLSESVDSESKLDELASVSDFIHLSIGVHEFFQS
ncbi:1068_t:CDS:2 [Cetraspora pellucida]|uniref:1068_t:CDS:1 n=1 Tax=Cetraspora pellucida TaxID=1433469 RepID=A0A9N9BWF3_9GLOM|nr:1068_t:CDS:2 [Cetraspora pellucida]